MRAAWSTQQPRQTTTVLHLVIQGPNSRQRLRHPLPPEATLSLGREGDNDVPVPWEGSLSRRHARLKCEADHVDVEMLPSAANPLFERGSAVRQCRVRAGDHFVVGETSFWVAAAAPSSSPKDPAEEVAFTRQQLQQVRFRDADRRIEVLSRLPEVISGAAEEKDLFASVTGVMLAGIPHADAVAVVTCSDEKTGEAAYWERRREAEGEFRPSGRLVGDALTREQSILHTWEAEQQRSGDYTVSAEFDWRSARRSSPERRVGDSTSPDERPARAPAVKERQEFICRPTSSLQNWWPSSSVLQKGCETWRGTSRCSDSSSRPPILRALEESSGGGASMQTCWRPASAT